MILIFTTTLQSTCCTELFRELLLIEEEDFYIPYVVVISMTTRFLSYLFYFNRRLPLPIHLSDSISGSTNMFVTLSFYFSRCINFCKYFVVFTCEVLFKGTFYSFYILLVHLPFVLISSLIIVLIFHYH